MACPPAEFSAVIPVRDDPVRLERLLAGLREHAPADLLREIIVVDDGSAEPPEAVCARHGAVMLRVSPGRGPGHARNVGVAAATGSHIFLFDADVTYAPGALEKAAALFAADPDLSAVSFFNQRYDAADSAVSNFVAVQEHCWFLKCLEGGADTGPLGGLMTRNGAIRRDVYEALGGFSEDYATNAGEDYDFGKRLVREHKSVITASPVFHHAYPTRVTRLFRNYFLRTALFVPYYLTHKPPLDKTQTSRGEALIRVTGVYAVCMLPLMPLPVVGHYAATAFICLLTMYLVLLWDFLRLAWEWSGRNAGFVGAFLLIHLATSCAIAAGGGWGLAGHFLSGGKAPGAAGGAP